MSQFSALPPQKGDLSSEIHFQESSFDRPYMLILVCAAAILFVISLGINTFLFHYAQGSTVSRVEKDVREQIYSLDLLTFSMIQGFGRVQSVLEGASFFSYDQVRDSLTPFLAKYQKFHGKISGPELHKNCILHGAGSPQNINLKALDMMGRFLSHGPKGVSYFFENFPIAPHFFYISKEFTLNCPWEGFPPSTDPGEKQDTESFLTKLNVPFLNNFPKWSALAYSHYDKMWFVDYTLPSFYNNILQGFFVFSVPQKFFFDFLDPLRLPFGKIFLVDQENTVMAELGKKEENFTVSFLKDRLPVELTRPENSIFLAPAGKMVYYPKGFLQGYWACTISLQKAPWKIIFIGSFWDVAKNDFYETFSDTLVIIVSLILMVSLSHWLMKSYFLKPAIQLIVHLDKERQSMETYPEKLPPRWQPWGILISKTFSENRYLVMELEKRVQQRTQALKKAIENLQNSQKQIIAQEKLASLGTLVAGIAHEMKNPLNFVMNFAETSKDFVQELKKDDLPQVQSQALLQDLENNMGRIIEYAKRTDHIVKSMLLHARSDSTTLEETDLNRLLGEYIDLCYQSFTVQNPHTPIIVEKKFALKLPLVNTYPQDIGRAFLNILSNAFGAVQHKFSQMYVKESSLEQYPYQPLISVVTQDFENSILVAIQDNGEGIPPEIIKKIFDPFFTTKGPTQGTGLGLSISYDCVQRHRGSLDVESRAGEGARFLIRIPKNLLSLNKEMTSPSFEKF